jgi:hypothetical protein
MSFCRRQRTSGLFKRLLLGSRHRRSRGGSRTLSQRLTEPLCLPVQPVVAGHLVGSSPIGRVLGAVLGSPSISSPPQHPFEGCSSSSAAATCLAAALISSSGTLGRTSSQRGRVMLHALSIPRGRGKNHTWK